MHRVDLDRRLVLRGGLAAGSLFLSAPYAWVWAQSEGTMKLLRAPKVALVLGNSKYKEAPLKNPANDAKAMADALKACGFDVTLKMDGGKADMAAAVQAYVQTLTARKCIGLFYYAGHGIQLAWRNYMLPVDADLDTLADIQKQGVEVNSLLEGITKAANPMNVIILDACRDNPFGNLKGVDHKGLSQMDAPNNTIISYATAPGNVASDGEGANGLYTENLLRELKVPEAKVEDVFKRVRLNVRLKSKGAQVPWDSSSLEDDFYFLPPAQLQKLSQAEKDRLLNEELAAWDRAREAKDPKLIEAFLQRYPGGNFSELAQLALDRALAENGEKKIEAASTLGNPYTKGSARTDIDYKVGDSYTYRVVNANTGAERRTLTDTVTQITDSEVITDSGRVTDLLGNLLRHRDGRRLTTNQTYPLEFSVGKRWNSGWFVTNAAGVRFRNESEFRIAAREKLTVPAGTFDAFRLEQRGIVTGGPMGPFEVIATYWLDPARLRSYAAYTDIRKWDRWQNSTGVAERYELVSFKQS